MSLKWVQLGIICEPETETGVVGCHTKMCTFALELYDYTVGALRVGVVH